MKWWLSAMLLALTGAAQAQNQPVVPAGNSNVRVIGRVRPLSPVRLGGIFTMGLGEAANLLEESAQNGTRLSEDNLNWLAKNSDLAAFNAVNILPSTFPRIQQQYPLFVPLLHFRASTLYEQPFYPGNVGGWRPAMSAWTLRDAKDKEVPYPTPGGHWMDFGSIEWAAHWRDQVWNWLRQFNAQGVVVSELPLGNTFVGSKLAKYKTPADRVEATYVWLRAAQWKGRFFLVPSTLGFDARAPRPTLPTPPGTDEPDLPGHLWDHYFPVTDGGWAEGWLWPYWSERPLPEAIREMHLQAADRAARNGQVFIATAAYRNDDDLEFLLANYLLVAQKHGRFVFQPMPLIPFVRSDAGFSLAVHRQQVKAKSAYFNVPLGGALQERMRVTVSLSAMRDQRAEAKQVWKRAFQNGIVYVNSNDTFPATIELGGTMKRITGEEVRVLEMAPRSGAILLYPNPEIR